jgi:hypothetical protein
MISGTTYSKQDIYLFLRDSAKMSITASDWWLWEGVKDGGEVTVEYVFEWFKTNISYLTIEECRRLIRGMEAECTGFLQLERIDRYNN